MRGTATRRSPIRHEHSVSELLQQRASDFLDLWIILDQQNLFAPSRRLDLYNVLFGELAMATR
jgi:hypothetical protein